MSRKRSKSKARSVLKDHKKKGSRFIPPLLQLENMQEVSYLNDALPNLIWMGLIFEKFGHKMGVDLINQFVTVAYEKCGDITGNFSYLCYYSNLDISLKSSIYMELRSRNILYPLQDAIAPLPCLFNNFPARFLKPDFKVDESTLLPRLKYVMKNCIDRYSKMSTAIQVTAFYNLGTNGKLHIASHIDVPDPNTIFTAPNSDEAKRAASFARTNINAELGFRKEDVSKGWVRDFWLQIYNLDKCELLEPR